MDYGLNDIDEYGCVKPGTGMIIAALFLCRQWFYGPLTMLATRKGRASSGADVDMSFIEVYSIWEFVACVPAIIVLVLLFRRKPEAGPRVRLLWSKAKLLLISAAAMQLAALLMQVIRYGVESSFIVVMLIANGYALIYVATSTRLADAVRQFPQKA